MLKPTRQPPISWITHLRKVKTIKEKDLPPIKKHHVFHQQRQEDLQDNKDKDPERGLIP